MEEEINNKMNDSFFGILFVLFVNFSCDTQPNIYYSFMKSLVMNGRLADSVIVYIIKCVCKW